MVVWFCLVGGVVGWFGWLGWVDVELKVCSGWLMCVCVMMRIRSSSKGRATGSIYTQFLFPKLGTYVTVPHWQPIEAASTFFLCIVQHFQDPASGRV